MIDEYLKNKIDFRLKQSREKLRLSSIMFKKGLNYKSLVFSYLAMFYAVRLLLINSKVDSDDHTKIIELIRGYLEPKGWISIEVFQSLQQTNNSDVKTENDLDNQVSKEKAEEFLTNAGLVLEEVLAKMANSHDLSSLNR
ncbi:MAG: HEPN domain-containing protein [Spirochaetota bacterium]|nr:HEPN domain-containing protein [Spirochaetota bacterium]